MTKQEENWELMTVLGMPWKDANELDGDDRSFLVGRTVEVKAHALKQQEMEAEIEAKAFAERVKLGNPKNMP
tara:strand:- start:84 stop:299 length:216 start_codon:yes stop_codon:yes gene_type:complete